MDNPLSRRTSGTGGRIRPIQEPGPGSPSRALRVRAAGGWAKFMRGADIDAWREADE
ncbi:hypothetical protein [Streptomyces sp. NPDC001717]|uniref:hypothetical protein n=1 Tax=Streptomyces sp. NPDC001717 TaxID=3364604 RepID=UPI0036BA7CD2